MKTLLTFLLALTWATLTAHASALPNGTPSISTSDGVKLYTRVAGRGLPCVFVHGGPGAGSQAVETLAGPVLEGQFQMIYLDQRGSGRSASAPDKSYGLDRLVLDLDELRQQLHLEKWVLMSHSFGGTIATAYASKYPQRVQGLILVNSILNLPASMESYTAAGYALLPAATRPPLDANAPLPQRFGMVSGLLGQQRLQGQLMYAVDTTAGRLARIKPTQPANHDFAASLFVPGVIDGYLQDFTQRTAQLNMPVLVLPGAKDQVVGPTHHLAFRFPQQKVVVMPGKHYALIESPREFGQALAAFAQQLGR